ncbi:MAG: recombination protein O N-terminal domain-containing protein [Patescibacteria group bacterium]
MKYDIHDTEALVMRSFPQGEDNLSVHLFTREFGCLYGRAQGVRKSTSRLKFGLTNMSYISAGLLIGKSGWRMTYLTPHTNLYFSLRDNISAQKVTADIVSVCARLIGESEGCQEVFDTVQRGLMDISSSNCEGEELREKERALMLKILYSLGYVESAIYFGLLENEGDKESGFAKKDPVLQKKMAREINRALKAAW